MLPQVRLQYGMLTTRDYLALIVNSLTRVRPEVVINSFKNAGWIGVLNSDEGKQEQPKEIKSYEIPEEDRYAVEPWCQIEERRKYVSVLPRTIPSLTQQQPTLTSLYKSVSTLSRFVHDLPLNTDEKKVYLDNLQSIRGHVVAKSKTKQKQPSLLDYFKQEQKD